MQPHEPVLPDCITGKRSHSVPAVAELDVFFSGTSCKDHSRLNACGKEHRGCLDRDTGGSSSYTYQHGWKGVLTNVQPPVAFFENVNTMIEHTSDSSGKKYPPAILAVENHAKDMGYDFAYTSVNSAFYLVRQRRNRVWGCASMQQEKSDTQWKTSWASTFVEMGSNLNFAFEDVFEEGLPLEKVFNPNQSEAVQRALQNAGVSGKGQNLFVDVTSSEKRCESNVAMLPCVNPKHPVYSTQLERFVKPKEFLSCQAIWARDFPVPQAVEAVSRTPLGQDLAGHCLGSAVTICTVQYCTVMYFTLLYCTVVYPTVYSILYCIL